MLKLRKIENFHVVKKSTEMTFLDPECKIFVSVIHFVTDSLG